MAVNAKPWLRAIAWAFLAVYVAWNAFWLAQGAVPPALLLGLTGLPAPTTGGLRAMHALLDGDWHGSLRCNPLAVPITALFVASIVWLAWKWLKRDPLRLPQAFLWLWGCTLGAAWILKLAGDRAYW